MSNSYAAWRFRVILPDMEALPSPDTHRPGEEHGNDDPGEGLPSDFPRDEFSDEQLVLLAEYYENKKWAVVRRFFELFRLHDGCMDLTLGHVILNAGILCKLLGIGDYRSYTDKALYESIGISETTYYRHKAALMKCLSELKNA